MSDEDYLKIFKELSDLLYKVNELRSLITDVKEASDANQKEWTPGPV